MSDSWRFVIDEALYNDLMRHLFPGDDDEHGAVIAAGLAASPRGTRLLARRLYRAREGIDFVPGRRGYRMLTAEFVGEHIRACRDERLVYLAVHNHGGRDSVDFSGTDMQSHERGYPALLDISGQPVGALVVAHNAIAGDIWTGDRTRRSVRETVVAGRNLTRIFPSPPPPPPETDPRYDRQVRWFGDRGQALLGRLKVAVIGGGGVGLPLATMLARLGVGHLVVIDPDRVEPENLPRLDATELDAMVALRRIPILRRLAARLSTRKVRLARRLAKRANPRIDFLGIPTNVIEPETARSLTDCDFIFLAADSHQARLVFNAVVHQYLIPGIQIGTRIDTEAGSGEVADIRTNIRLVLPDSGCLRCNNLISATKLQDESRSMADRTRNRYADELPAPSVITFNTTGAAQATTDFLLMMGGLIAPAAPVDYLRNRPRERRTEPVTPLASRSSCTDCGLGHASRRARGDWAELPLPQR
jgi:molybdopterin/thiamine biosynthesis adenylyltransferase